MIHIVLYIRTAILNCFRRFDITFYEVEGLSVRVLGFQEEYYWSLRFFFPLSFVSFVFRKSVSEELCAFAPRAATVMSEIETKTNKFHEKGEKKTEHERDEITKCSKSNRMS